MINEFLYMNGYGSYVWSAFSFTFLSFSILYIVIKIQYVKERNKFIVVSESGSDFALCVDELIGIKALDRSEFQETDKVFPEPSYSGILKTAISANFTSGKES